MDDQTQDPTDNQVLDNSTIQDSQGDQADQPSPSNQGNEQDIVDPDDAKHEDAESPSVKGETNTMSGDMPEEAAVIDDEMEKIGKDIDPEHPEPLGED